MNAIPISSDIYPDKSPNRFGRCTLVNVTTIPKVTKRKNQQTLLPSLIKTRSYFAPSPRRHSPNLYTPSQIRLLLPLTLRLTTPHRQLRARIADLIRADPLPLHGPGAPADVLGVVAGEVAVFDQAAAGVVALEVDDFELGGGTSVERGG